MEQLSVTLNNGVKMPALGLGVLQSEGSEATTAVSTALQVGYRLIDTAAAYFNEREVGRGIRESGIDRADIFLTTKLWMTDYGYVSALRGFDTSTAKLGVDYVDSTCCTGRGRRARVRQLRPTGRRSACWRRAAYARSAWPTSRPSPALVDP